MFNFNISNFILPIMFAIGSYAQLEIYRLHDEIHKSHLIMERQMDLLSKSYERLYGLELKIKILNDQLLNSNQNVIVDNSNVMVVIGVVTFVFLGLFFFYGGNNSDASEIVFKGLKQVMENNHNISMEHTKIATDTILNNISMLRNIEPTNLNIPDVSLETLDMIARAPLDFSGGLF